MKRLATILALGAMGVGSAWAQGNGANRGALADLGGTLYASTFANWSVPMGNNGPLAWSYATACNSATTGGATFKPLMVGTPIQIVDANTADSEVVTVTAVKTAGSGCMITVSPSNPHESFYLTSATAGLQEAINYAGSKQNVVIITPEFTRAGGTTSTITSAQGNANVTILDERSSLMVPYTWNGTAYVATSFPGSGGAAFPSTPNSVVVNTSTSASRPATASDLATLLTGTTGCATSGYVYSPSSNTCIPAGTASAAGSTGAVQVNSSGAFSGPTGLTYNSGSQSLNVAGGVTAASLTANGTGGSHGWDFPEGTTVTSGTGHEVLSADATTHTVQLSSNGGTPSPVCTASNGQCPGGTGANPAGSTYQVQVNGGSSTFGASGAFTFNPTTNLIELAGGQLSQDVGGCYNSGLSNSYCNWLHSQFSQTHTQSGAETQAVNAGDYAWWGDCAYNGFPSGAVNAFNNCGRIKDYFSAEFRGPGFKRILDSTMGAGTSFVGIGDWSVENWMVGYTNSFCCGADESGTAFRWTLQEMFGFLTGTASSVTTTTTTAPDAAGQGPFASPTTKVAVVTTGNAGPISTGSMLGDLAGANATCGTAMTIPLGTYPAGQACGTFTATESAFDGGSGVGQIPVNIAYGTVPDITAYGSISAAVGDSTNRYNYSIGVAQNVTVAVHGGTTGTFVPGMVCIAGGTIECSRVTSVGTLSGGSQTLVVNVHKFHPINSEVIQAPAPGYALILHDDVNTFLTPYPYRLFGKVGSNLIYGVQKGGGVNFGDPFRQGAKPNAYTATWSAVKAAEIIVDNTGEYGVPTYQIEDTGWVPATSDAMIGMPFPSRRDNMFEFNDFSSNPSDPSVKSSNVSVNFGGQYGTPGAVTTGYSPFSINNTTGCPSYFSCGGKVDPPDSAIDITGVYGNILRVSQPSLSHTGDQADTVIGIYAGTGTDNNADYNFVTFTTNNNYGGTVWTQSSLTGDTYINGGQDYVYGSQWLSGNQYQTGMGALYGGNIYIALTSSTGAEPDTHPANWALVTTTSGSAWSSTTAYAAASVVSYAGQTYFALAANTNVAPGTNGDWSILYHPPGFWVDGGNLIGFADGVKGGAHVKHGALSLDPAPNTWDLGNGLATGDTTWNLKLNSIIMPSLTSQPCVGTDSNGKIVAGTCSGSGSMVYPAAGVAVSTGSAWGTSVPASTTVNGVTCALGSTCTVTAGGTASTIVAPNGSLGTFQHAISNANTTPVHVTIHGDSFNRDDNTTSGDGPLVSTNRYPEQIRIALQAVYGSHGTGVYPVVKSQSGTPNLDSEAWTCTGTFDVNTSSLGPGISGGSALLHMATGAVCTFADTRAIPYSKVSVYYGTPTTSSSLAIVADGGTSMGTATSSSTATGVTNGGLTAQRYDSSTTLTPGTHSIAFTCTGDCYLYAAEGVNGTSGVSVDNMAVGGSRSDFFGGSTTNQLAFDALIPGGIQAAVAMDQTNDVYEQYTPSSFSTYMQNWITASKALPGSPSVILMIPPVDSIAGSTYTPPAYNSVQRTLCSSNSIACGDITQAIGTSYIASYFDSGTIHPNDATARWLGQIGLATLLNEMNPLPATGIAGMIAPGTNVSITGSGTTASPYTISASGGGGGGGAMTNITSVVTVSGCTVSGSVCTVVTPGSTVTLSSIPGTYSEIRIVWNGRSTTSIPDMDMEINGDTGSNYDIAATYVSGGVSAIWTQSTTPPLIGWVADGAATAGASGGGTISIPNYAGTTFWKQATSLVGARRSSGPFAGNFGVTWHNTAAITSLSFFVSGDTFTAGTTFSIYGIQ